MESPATGLLPCRPILAAAANHCAYSNTLSLLIFHALPAQNSHRLPIAGTLILSAIFLLFIRQRKRSKVSVTR